MGYKVIKIQRGFTLVEVLVVMLILVALASVTLDFTKDFAFQGRYEVTKDRYDKIKRAIIGRPDALINGQPDISGFVADMGRLPNNIRELLDQDYCLPDRTIDDTVSDYDTGTYASAQLHCDGVYGANSWIIQDNNWSGPYLTVTKKVVEGNAFSDGWGNEPTDYCTDLNFTAQAACTGAGNTWYTAIQNHNYGWYYNVDTSEAIDELHFFSLGKDQALGGAALSYDADFPSSTNHPNEPPILNSSDWKVLLPQITIAMQTPIQNSKNCITNGITNIASCSLANWNWFGKPECRDSINILTSDNSEAACIATPGNVWYWITSWPIEFCTDNTETTEADCIAAPSTWNKSLCSDTTKKNIQDCIDASGTWSSNGEWPVTDARCTNRYFSTSVQCKTAGHKWLTPFCSDLISATKAACTIAGKKWIISFCSSSNQVNEAACFADGGLWGGCLDNTNSKYFCDSNGGAWITDPQKIEIEITYPFGAGGNQTATATTTLEENGLNQIIVFNRDEDSDGVVFFVDADNDGIEDAGEDDITDVPQGITKLSIFKAGLDGVIYPPSCSGLSGDSDSNGTSDCVEASGTLLNNGLCDDITINDCIAGADGTSGNLLRNTIEIPFVAHKSISTINW